MIVSFFCKNGPVATIAVEDQRMKIADWCTVICLPEVIAKIRVHFPGTPIILYHDNANSHASKQTSNYLRSQSIELMPYCPDSPDLSPSDYFFFPNVRRKMRGECFTSPEAAVEAYRSHTIEISALEWEKCFRRVSQCFPRHLHTMGLCKCPKRLVTNLFCFEHRVNVCENCIVTSHPKVMKSFSHISGLFSRVSCFSLLSALSSRIYSGSRIKILIADVFHWKCINSRQESLPSNTAPGGHSCPTCAEKIFPPAHLVSPVADVLRSRLSQVNWGRNELGLPLLAEEKKDMRNAIAGPSQGTSGVTNTKANKDNWDAYQQPQSHSVLNIDTFN
uniref:Zinc finger protein-like 1 homolog n=1 Tax=Lutzomyia longipalpis TaxID=7200 RepID=A0A1B0CCE3_LUTLO